MTEWDGAAGIAAAVTRRSRSARGVVDAALARIAGGVALNAFTTVMAERAVARAAAIDADVAAGRPAGPLAGGPVAGKHLFDLKGVVTRAGSRINRANPAATADAALVTRLERAGGVLVGALNMGEYAYDFTGENLHDGPSRNPQDTARMTGGSSGGSAGAVAGGLVPLALGSDTNGSIRVPASFCGLFGLKPTYGRLSRAGTFPFVASLDHLGPLARNATDLALAYDAMQGPDATDPACAGRPVEPTLPRLREGVRGLRVGVAGGHFARGLTAEARDAVARVAAGLAAETGTALRDVELPETGRARSAAYVITAAEGAALHLARLRGQADQFDPAVRDPRIAGALLPAPLVAPAQRVRRGYRAAVLRAFDGIDLLVAPATPCTAPLIGQQEFMLDGEMVPLRPNIGVYTQPISFIGLPVVSVPVPLPGLPIGVQLVCAPWREDLALRAAAALEARGPVRAPRPPA